MSYRYYIQRASYEESEDPGELFFSQAEWHRAVKALNDNPLLSEFTFSEGYATFLAEEWTDTDPRIEIARQLASQLNARIFGEEDEEYV